MDHREIPVQSAGTHAHEPEVTFQYFFGVSNKFILIEPERIGRNCAVVIATKQTYAYANV